MTPPRVLEASAGTGKTWRICDTIARLVANDGVPITRIVAVTFTEAAAAELRDRVRRRLREVLLAARAGGPGEVEWLPRSPEARVARRLEAALADFDDAPISTIHSFCQRLRRDLPLAAGTRPDVDLAPDPGPALHRLAVDHIHRVAALLPPRVAAGLTSPLDVDGLTEVARLASDPDAPIHPPDPGPVPLPDLDGWVHAIARLRDLWDPDAIVRNIHAADVLKRRTRGVDGFPTGATRTDALAVLGWLRAPDPTAGAIPGIARFRAAYIRAAVKRGPPPDHPALALVEDLVARHTRVADAMGAWTLSQLHRVARAARIDLANARLRDGLRTYNELLRDIRDAIDDDHRGPRVRAAARARYHAALVDEFQDTDPVQWAIFEALFPEGLWLVGDPKQSIYRFRGADLPTWYRAIANAEPEHLDTNWRSDPGLVEALDHLLRRDGLRDPLGAPEPRVHPVAAAHPHRRLHGDDHPPLRIVYAPMGEVYKSGPRRGMSRPNPTATCTARFSDWIAGDIVAHLAAGLTVEDADARHPVTAGDCAVLVRNNDEAVGVVEALRRAGVPAVVRSDQRVVDAPIVAELLLVLDALLDPTAARVKRAFTAERTGRSADALQAAMDDPNAWSALLLRYRAWSRLWTERGVAAALRAWIDDDDVAVRLLADPDGERHLTDLLHLVEVLHTVSRTWRLGPAALRNWLAAPTKEDDRWIRRLETDRDAVQVMTTHVAKGLEFGLVWCASLWRGARTGSATPFLFTDRDHDHRRSIDLGSADAPRRQRWNDLDAIAEEHRLMYVALTRAKHRCTVLWTVANGVGPLATLLHQRPGDTDIPSAIAARLTDDQELQPDLARLAAHPHIDLRVVPLEAMQAPAPAAPAPAPALAVHPLSRADVPDRWWRRTSYTGLVRGADAIAVDVDDPDLDPTSTLVDVEIPLADLPGGRRLGVALHAVLEHADFQAPDALQAHVATHLAWAGVDGAWVQPVTEALAKALEADIGGLRLADVPRCDRRDELSFTLPLRGGLARAGQRLRAAALADAFDHPDAPPGGRAAIAGLDFVPVRGFLVGSIDLVARHGGRYFLADYKTNHLGRAVADYAPDALQRAMDHARYGLQAALYALALHRWLGSRLPSYDPARHIGPVRYLFLRGMSPETPGRGVWCWQPTAGFLDALGAALEGR